MKDYEINHSFRRNQNCSRCMIMINLQKVILQINCVFKNVFEMIFRLEF